MNNLRLKKKILLLTLSGALLPQINVNAEKSLSQENLDKLNNYFNMEEEYYSKNPSLAIIDGNEAYLTEKRGETTLDNGGEKKTGIVSYVYTPEKAEYKDIVYLTGVGNSHATGDGEKTKEFSRDDGLGVVVGIKNDKEYSYAVAKYDEENDTALDIIGWFKNSDVKKIRKMYATTIDMPIKRKITFGNTIGYSYEEGKKPEDYDLITYESLDDASYWLSKILKHKERPALNVGFTGDSLDGYTTRADLGVYVKNNTTTYEDAKYEEDSKTLKKKYNIINVK